MKLKQILTLAIILGCGSAGGGGGSLFSGDGVFVSTEGPNKGIFNRSSSSSYFFTMNMTPASLNGATTADKETIESKLLFHVNPADFIREARVQSGSIEQDNGDGFAEVTIISQSSDHIEYSVNIGEEEEAEFFNKSKGFLKITKISGSGFTAKYTIEMGLRAKKIADGGTDYFVVADATAKYGFDIVTNITDKRVIDVMSIETNQTFSLVEATTATNDITTAYAEIAKNTLTALANNFPITSSEVTVVKVGIKGEGGIINFSDASSGTSFDKLENDLVLLFPIRFNDNALDNSVNQIKLHDNATTMDINHAYYENGILEIEMGSGVTHLLEAEDSKNTNTKIYAIKKNGTVFTQIFIVPQETDAIIVADATKRFGYKVKDIANITSEDPIKMLQISTEFEIIDEES